MQLLVLKIARSDGDGGDPAFCRRLDIIWRVADDDHLGRADSRQLLERGREAVERRLGLLDVVTARRRGNQRTIGS